MAHYYCSNFVDSLFVYKVATGCCDNFTFFAVTSFWSCVTLVLIMVFIHYFHLTFLFINCIQIFQWSSGHPSIIGRHKTHNPQYFKEKVCVSFFVARLRIKLAQNKNPPPKQKRPRKKYYLFFTIFTQNQNFWLKVSFNILPTKTNTIHNNIMSEDVLFNST